MNVDLYSFMMSWWFGPCSQVYEADQEHRTEVLQLQERLSVLEREASQHETLMSSVLKENRDQITKLQEDKAVLEVILRLFVNKCLILGNWWFDWIWNLTMK